MNRKCDKCGKDLNNDSMYDFQVAVNGVWVINICVCEDCVDKLDKLLADYKNLPLQGEKGEKC